MSSRPPQRNRAPLMRSQIVLSEAIETNQGALVDQVENIIRPVDEGVQVLRAQVVELTKRVEILEQQANQERSA